MATQRWLVDIAVEIEADTESEAQEIADRIGREAGYGTIGAGAGYVRPAEPQPEILEGSGQVIDLMAALKESLKEHAKRAPEPIEPLDDFLNRITEAPTASTSHED